MPESTSDESAAVGSGSESVASIAVGLPVYNGEKFIAQALDSLLGQTTADISIIVSDNASTDRTGLIVSGYALRDPRITYIRQERNIGAQNNFKFVFRAAKSEYFMWAAADDVRSAEFIERNLAFLRTHPDFVGSTFRTRFEGGAFDPAKMGDETLEQDDFAERLIAFFTVWHANGRFYSLFRRRLLTEWVNTEWSFLAFDWCLITNLAARGKLNRIDEGLVELGRHGESRSTDVFAPYRTSLLLWFMPLHGLTVDTWRLMALASRGQRVRIAWRLLKLNVLAFLLQHKLMLTRRS